MKKVINNKGFTLVEVLAVIVILLILSMIGIVTVVNIRQNQELEFDQSQTALFKEIAKIYFTDNKSLLPIVNNSTNVVYLNELIEGNYLDSMLQYNKESYVEDMSYVQVKKVGSKYIYTPYLCKVINKDKCTEAVVPNNKHSSIIEFSKYKKENSDMVKIESKYYTNKTGTVELKIKDEDGIAVWFYKVYKNGKVYKTSDMIEPSSKISTDKIILDLNQYEDATYEIKVTVYDNEDGMATAKSEKIVIDTVAPTCDSYNINGTTGENGWYKSDVNLTVKCKDNVSGCINNEYTKKVTSEGDNTVSIAIKDKADNSRICNVPVTIKIDKTLPKCEINVTGTIESLDWYKPSPTLTLNYSDALSGISVYNLSQAVNVTTYNMKNTATQGETNGTTWYGTVKDKAGNVGKCQKTIKVKKLPLCRRATQLHTEICNSETYMGCIDAGISKGATITYGTIGVNGTLASGNAFDCDVNGDGNYDATTERFYYVTDLNTTTAVLIYYSNTTYGLSYDSSGENWKGPVSAIKNLPTISTWSNVNLVKPIRTITNDQGETNVNGKNLPTAFSYEGYVARLLTYQEVIAACNIPKRKIGYDDTVVGELYGCNYLLEKTQYANKNASYSMSHYWLETPTQYTFGRLWPAAAIVWATGGYVSYHPTDNEADEGIRPVIEVLKSNMIY